MSDTSCQPGDTHGFPLKISQSLFSKWPATDNPMDQIQKLIIPTDFTVQWGPPTQSAQISVTQTTISDNSPGLFQIRGISTITDSTSLTYGNATYRCSGVLSIVQNQHPFFCQDKNALYEVILSFQIANKSMNPSSPDIILLTRPIVFSTWNSSTFWPAVDEACMRNTTKSVALDMSTMFGYNASVLMPMVSYQSCLPVKLLNYKNMPYFNGSLRIRVNTVLQPIYMVASENGLGRCSSIRRYTLTTEPRRPVDIFENVSANTILQFQDGYGSDSYPIQTTQENLVPNNSGTPLTAFTDILHTIEIVVPEEFLGKSFAEISAASKLTDKTPKKKAFKCYTIDPNKDIIGDQIMIDPTTGDPLKDTLQQEALAAAGGDPIYTIESEPSGLMPRDIERILTVILIVIGIFAILIYLVYIGRIVFYKEHGFNEALPHIIIFVVIFISLFIISIYFGSLDTKDNSTNSNNTDTESS
jgi:hypothetical protein